MKGTIMKEERSLYDQIELYILTHEPCYQKDIVRCFEGKYSKQYIMQTCYKLLGNTAFKRPDPQKPNSFLKTNKAIFEVLSVSIAHLTECEQEILVQRKEQFKNEIYSLFTDDTFIKSITSGTAKTPQVEYRHTKVQQLIKQVISYDN